VLEFFFIYDYIRTKGEYILAKNYCVFILLIIFLSDYTFGQTNRTFEEFSNIDISEYLSLLEENIYFTNQLLDNEGIESNIIVLYEVQVENNMPVLYRFDYIEGEKIIFERTVLPDHVFSSYGSVNVFSFGVRHQSRSMNPQIYFIEHSDGTMTIMARAGGVRLFKHPSNNINEIMTELSNLRRETRIQYTGIYRFERVEIISDIGSNEDSFSDPFEVLSVVFTGAGNLFIYSDNDDKLQGYFFTIQDHDNPMIFRNSGNINFFPAQGYSYTRRDDIENPFYWYSIIANDEQYYFFDGDYFVFYSSRKYSVYEYDTDIEYQTPLELYEVMYRIYYNRTNGT